MQTITENRRLDDGFMQQFRDKMVGNESPELKRAFAVRRAAAEKRLEDGEIDSLTIREDRRISRNDPCPCGSKEKFKKCCGSRLSADDTRVKE